MSDRDEGTGIAAAAGAPARPVDREPQLRVLGDALRSAMAGHGSAVVISGAIGIGKTSLLDATARIAVRSGAQVFRAVAATMEQDMPLGVVRQLCEPAVADLTDAERQQAVDGIAEKVRPFLTDRACVAGTEWILVGDQSVPHALRHLLSVASRRRPMVLMVDDLQYADAESVRCLRYLARRLHGLAVLLVVAVRDGVAGSDDPQIQAIVEYADHELRPAPLSMEGVRALIRSLFDEPGSDQFATMCRAVSGGNPLAVRAILEHVRAAGGEPTGEFVELVRTARPPLLREWLLSRLRGQQAAPIAYLQALWCLGPRADLPLIARLADLDDLTCAELARTLTKQGLLRPDHPGDFAHTTVRDAVERLISTPDVERLHSRAATVLHEAGHPAAEVAPHLLAVPAQQDIWAVDVLRDASAQALSRGENAAAARFLRRALLERNPYRGSRAALLLDLAAAERHLDMSASVRHVLEAASLSPSPSTRAAALTWLSPLTIGATTPAVPMVIRAVAAELGDIADLSGHDRDLALRLEARIRASDHGTNQVDAALDRLKSLDREQSLATSAGRELLAVLIEIAAAAGVGPSADVAYLGRRMLDLEAASATTLAVVPMVVSALALADRASTAVSWLDAAAASVERHKDSQAVATVAACHALVHLATGEIGQGVASASTAIDLAGTHWPEAITLTGMLTVTGLADLRSPDTGRDGRGELAERIADLCAKRTDDPLATTLRRLMTAHCGPSATNPVEVVEHLLDCGRQLDRAGWRNPAMLAWRSDAAWLHHRLGNTADALDLAEAEHELATAWGAPAPIGRALRARGAMTPGAEGVALLRAAAEILDDSENQLEQARTHLLLGARLARSGSDDAEVHLRRGRALAEAGSGPGLVEQELRLLADQGPNPAGAAGSRLTKAERRVVALAAGGQTNQAIADELAVTRRAVEKHLTNAYHKLNIPGRAELADAWELEQAAMDPGELS